MKRTNRCKSIELNLLKFVLLSSFVITSCSEGPQSADPPEPFNIGLAEPSESDSLPQVLPLENPESESLQVDSLSLNSQYPADTENDDRPGLIVTGINGVENLNPESPYLLSASMFRLEQKTPGTGDGHVHMVVYDEGVSASAHIDFYQPPLNTCLLRDIESSELDTSDDSNASASGGASVVINSPSGTWFTFHKGQTAHSQLVYQVNNELPGRLPTGATLSVPGDEFPNVPSYPIFEPEAIERLLPSDGQVVSAITEYTWVPGHASSHVKINLLSYDNSDEFKGFPVTCWAPDGGRFDMPENVLGYIESSELTLKARFSRVYARLDWANGMMIHQYIEVAE